MFFARFMLLVLPVSLIVFQHSDAWRRRRRRRCPIRNCEVSSWSSWSLCSAYSCGQRGNQSRLRTITSHPSCGGAACSSPLHQTRQCYSSTRLVNCQLSSWSEWSACTTTSASRKMPGTQFSSRHRITKEQCGGTCMLAFHKTRTCSRTSVNCKLSPWSQWSACTLMTCDVFSGIQFSTRHKIIKEKRRGRCTSKLRTSQSCISNFTCRNGGSLNEGSCSCKEGFSGVCCEEADSSSQGMYSKY